MGRFLFMCQLGRFICMCQMGRSKSLCQMGRLKSFCQMGRSKSLCQMGLLKIILSNGAIKIISCICINLSLVSPSKEKRRKKNIELVFVSFSIFCSDEYFKLKRNVVAQFFDNGCIFLFDVVIYYWFYFMGVED